MLAQPFHQTVTLFEMMVQPAGQYTGARVMIGSHGVGQLFEILGLAHERENQPAWLRHG